MPWFILFPPGKSGGLIEARERQEIEAGSPREFPPGKSGGLIEAPGGLLHPIDSHPEVSAG